MTATRLEQIKRWYPTHAGMQSQGPIKELIEALEAEMEKTKWRPVEDAHKDAKAIIFGPWEGEINGGLGVSAGVGVCVNGFWRASLEDAYAVTCEPTHFLPLPKPPTEGEG